MPLAAVGVESVTGGPAVWVLENGKPKRVGVTLGISDGVGTEVTAGELKEGQAIIVETVKQAGGNNRPPSSPRMF